MINREHISSLNGFRHTDFGYFAPVPLLADAGFSSEARESNTPKGSRRDERNTDSRGGRNQSPRSAVIESHDGQLPIEQHNNLTALWWGSGRGGARW